MITTMAMIMAAMAMIIRDMNQARIHILIEYFRGMLFKIVLDMPGMNRVFLPPK